ncbi:MAG: glycosyltransferase family 2 protein [Caulobacterales bacterium]|nr:glycosyltransferase family 2 protein [Caulobacterales bacterium]
MAIDTGYAAGAPSQPASAEARPTLGVVTISYNEERDLPGFIAHLRDWVDEIVIIDDGSQDRTAEIAAAGGEKVKFAVSPREEGEFYSHQRNKGIDAAKSDWLLHMDIDERVPPDLAREIEQAIRDDDRDGYRYRRLNYFLHRPMRGGGWQDWNLVHLARRHKFRFGGMFHEDCLIDAPPERVGQLAGKMIHLNEDGFAKRLRKSENYLPEVVKAVEDRGGKITFMRILTVTLFEFVKKYLVKRGFLDGTPGLISAIHAATAVFRAHALVWDRQNPITRGDVEREVMDQWAAAKTRASTGG